MDRPVRPVSRYPSPPARPSPDARRSPPRRCSSGCAPVAAQLARRASLLDRRMEFPRGKDLVEGLDRRLRTERSEIRRDVVLEAVAEQVSERDLADLGDVDTVDDLRALPLHIDQRLLH